MRRKPTPDEVADATPGERLLYALGQLYLRWRHDPATFAPPHQLDLQDVARTRWVCATVEYVQEGEFEDEGLLFLHLPSEVIVIDYRQQFPWRLLGLDEWGECQERRDFLRREA